MNKAFEVVVLPEWLEERVGKQGETKMGGFQTGNVKLHTSEEYFCVISYFKYIFYVEGYEYVPFGPEDIEDIVVTHAIPKMLEFDRRTKKIAEMGFFRNLPEMSIPIRASES